MRGRQRSRPDRRRSSRPRVHLDRQAPAVADETAFPLVDAIVAPPPGAKQATDGERQRGLKGIARPVEASAARAVSDAQGDTLVRKLVHRVRRQHRPGARVEVREHRLAERGVVRVLAAVVEEAAAVGHRPAVHGIEHAPLDAGGTAKWRARTALGAADPRERAARERDAPGRREAGVRDRAPVGRAGAGKDSARAARHRLQVARVRVFEGIPALFLEDSPFHVSDRPFRRRLVDGLVRAAWEATSENEHERQGERDATHHNVQTLNRTLRTSPSSTT